MEHFSCKTSDLFFLQVWVGIKTPSTFVCFHVDENTYLNLMEANNPDSLCYLPNQAALIHLVITPTGSEYDNQVYPKKRNTAMHVFT
jgi:hypothetical protein